MATNYKNWNIITLFMVGCALSTSGLQFENHRISLVHTPACWYDSKNHILPTFRQKITLQLWVKEERLVARHLYLIL